MRARLEGNRLVIRDQPLGFWLFYSFFVAGGSIALTLSLNRIDNIGGTGDCLVSIE